MGTPTKSQVIDMNPEYDLSDYKFPKIKKKEWSRVPILVNLDFSQGWPVDNRPNISDNDIFSQTETECGWSFMSLVFWLVEIVAHLQKTSQIV